MNKPSPTFEIEDLKHRYNGAPVLDIDRLSIAAGSITGLVGPNGSGKSTLLRMLGCIERPSEGRIVYQGQPIRPFAEAARFRITLLPQEPFLMKRSVFKNVGYGLKLRGEKNHVENRVREALAFVGLPADRFASRPWYALSGGESQRVALAARLVLKPKVLLLDEPTASVDVGSAQLIKAAALRARQEWGTTIVVASHDIQWLYDICDDLLHLFRGRVLGRRHATIVLGPWEKSPDGVYGKTLGVASRLAVSAPPHTDAAALIPFTLHEPDDRGGAKTRPDVCVHGIIRRISLEKSTGKLIATMMAGDLAIDVALTEAQIRKRGFLPGARLTACYRLEEIAWI